MQLTSGIENKSVIVTAVCWFELEVPEYWKMLYDATVGVDPIEQLPEQQVVVSAVIETVKVLLV